LHSDEGVQFVLSSNRLIGNADTGVVFVGGGMLL